MVLDDSEIIRAALRNRIKDAVFMNYHFPNAVALNSERIIARRSGDASNATSFASALDREADLQLQHGRHIEAERLAHRAAEVRAGAVA